MDNARALHDAAETGDMETVERLLRSDPYLVGLREDYKLTPLHRAAMAGHAGVAEALLARSAHVDARDYGGGTPLHGAAARGWTEAARVLLDRQADPNARDEEGHTPLHHAARHGHEGVAALLLSRGADPNVVGRHSGTPLHEAAGQGRGGMVALLLERGALANARSAGSHLPFTPWHAARDAGHAHIAELLADHGGQDKAAQAVSIHRAAEAGYLGRLKVLVKAEPELVPSHDYLYRRTPLHWAAFGGSLPAAELLLANGADIARKDKKGLTPLDHAAAQGHDDIATLLRRAGEQEPGSVS